MGPPCPPPGSVPVQQTNNALYYLGVHSSVSSSLEEFFHNLKVTILTCHHDCCQTILQAHEEESDCIIVESLINFNQGHAIYRIIIVDISTSFEQLFHYLNMTIFTGIVECCTHILCQKDRAIQCNTSMY